MSRCDVHVPVTVQVGGEEGAGAGRAGRDHPLLPCESVAADVLVPGDLVVVHGGRQEIEVAVAVDVRHLDVEGIIDSRGHRASGPDAAARARAQEDANGRRAATPHDSIDMAVSIEVAHRHGGHLLTAIGDIRDGAELSMLSFGLLATATAFRTPHPTLVGVEREDPARDLRAVDRRGVVEGRRLSPRRLCPDGAAHERHCAATEDPGQALGAHSSLRTPDCLARRQANERDSRLLNVRPFWG
jgi:hypothetical protein